MGPEVAAPASVEVFQMRYCVQYKVAGMSNDIVRLYCADKVVSGDSRRIKVSAIRM